MVDLWGNTVLFKRIRRMQQRKSRRDDVHGHVDGNIADRTCLPGEESAVERESQGRKHGLLSQWISQEQPVLIIIVIVA